MKTFDNLFSVDVELRSIGTDVVSATVMLSMRFFPVDHKSISQLILARLLPAWVVTYPLHDGSFVLISSTEDEHVDNFCIPCLSTTLPLIESYVELEDGKIHLVRISLEQSNSSRRDFVIPDRRFIRLRGNISVEVLDDEACHD